ncbi:MAG: hypothetical protein QOH61_2073 [Chloroflexota bacterium]|nr:hypothetical protein [Chloroflexota bacterium]
MGTAAVVGLACLLVGISGPVRADACILEMPPDVRFARGYTFIATFTSHRRMTAAGSAASWTFAVEEVFAGGDGPMTKPPYNISLKPATDITFSGNGCAEPRHLHLGDRYLVSTGLLDRITTPYSVFWEIDDAGDIRLVREYTQLGWQMDPRFDEPRTLAEAVALMAPGAELPPTDALAADRPSGDASVTPGSIPPAVLGLAIGALAAGGLRRRLRTHRGPCGPAGTSVG